MANMKSIYLPRFTIGEDAFDLFKSEMGKYGTKVAVVHGEKAWKASKEYVVPAIEKAGLELTGEVLYGHEATYENLEAILTDERVQQADMILGVGGGKCLDTVKLAADKLGKPVFTVPSIASNLSLIHISIFGMKAQVMYVLVMVSMTEHWVLCTCWGFGICWISWILKSNRPENWKQESKL